MKKKHLFSFVLCLLSLFMIMSGCSQDRQSHDSIELTDTSKKLNVTEFPNNGVSIGQHTKLVFSFNKPVNISSLVVSGTLYAECNGGVWSSVKYTNDTLTIKPADKWTTGIDRTIVIDAVNAPGEAVQFAYSYTVINQVSYVSPAGHDYSPGSLTQPKKTIQAAIQQAVDSDEVTEIHVAQGTYAVNYQQGTDIKMQNGILLYGGYSPINWNDRNIELYETIIKDYSMAGENNSPVTFGETLNTFSILDGFTIIAGSGITSSGIKIKSSATKVTNNTIFDLLLAKSSTVLSNNSSDGVTGVLFNNTIVADDTVNSCRLIWSYYASGNYYTPEVKMYNNILSGFTSF